MQIWIDTLDQEIIESAKEMNIICGVTTNPAILASSPLPPRQTIDRLLAIQPGKVAVQVTRHDTESMLAQARKLAHYNNRLIIKIPVTVNGLKVMARLKKENIPFLATTILDPNQFYIASLVGASYGAPYLGAIDKTMGNYEAAIFRMLNITRQQNLSTKIMAAGINDVEQVLFCAEVGVQAVTMPTEIFMEFICAPDLVDTYLKKFDHAWENRDDELFRVEEKAIN